MTVQRYRNLNREKALIWRIVHRDNVTWVLEHGLHCSSAKDIHAPNWVSIGQAELIDKRARHEVPIAPGGSLSDYVPFYFTPFSAMMYNILSGRNVHQRQKDEIVILVSSIPHIERLRLPYVFTDSHAYYQWANYYSDPHDLHRVDWDLLQRRDFKRDPDDPAKFERYQAEALVHRYVPIEGMIGIICHSDAVAAPIQRQVLQRNLSLRVLTKPGWYFT